MEPQIQYARTEDGVSIAYWTLGEGEPALVVLPPLVASHIAWEWQYAPLRTWYESLAERRMIVRYDWRGQGLSDRRISDISLDPLLSDMDAVTQRLGLSRYAIISNGTRWQVAVGGALRQPDRVSHLVLVMPVEMRSELSPQVRARREMFNANWEEYTEIVARTFLDRRSAHEAPLYAQFIRQAIDPDVWSLLFDLAVERAWDVEDRLRDVAAPALVIMPPTPAEESTALARKLASRIPDGRLVVAAGGSASGFGFADLGGDVRVAIDNFLGGTVAAVPDAPGGTAIILFADIVDSTGLTERMGDAAFRERARELDGALRAGIRGKGGTPVEGKLLGDGVLAVFTSAREAINGAVQCRDTGEAYGLPLHVGVHAGDVIREADNVYGGAVNIASRIAGASAPGEILVSDTVRSLARTSAGVVFEDRGEHEMKGIADPVRVYAVKELP